MLCRSRAAALNTKFRLPLSSTSSSPASYLLVKSAAASSSSSSSSPLPSPSASGKNNVGKKKNSLLSSIASQGNKLIEERRSASLFFTLLEAIVRILQHRDQDSNLFQKLRAEFKQREVEKKDPFFSIFQVFQLSPSASSSPKVLDSFFLKLYFKEIWRHQKETATIETLVALLTKENAGLDFCQQVRLRGSEPRGEKKQYEGDSQAPTCIEKLEACRYRFLSSLKNQSHSNFGIVLYILGLSRNYTCLYI